MNFGSESKLKSALHGCERRLKFHCCELILVLSWDWILLLADVRVNGREQCSTVVTQFVSSDGRPQRTAADVSVYTVYSRHEVRGRVTQCVYYGWRKLSKGLELCFILYIVYTVYSRHEVRVRVTQCVFYGWRKLSEGRTFFDFISVCLPAYLPTYLPTYLSIYLSVCVYIYIYVCSVFFVNLVGLVFVLSSWRKYCWRSVRRFDWQAAGSVIEGGREGTNEWMKLVN